MNTKQYFKNHKKIMKKNLAFIALIGFSISLKAQTTSASNTLSGTAPTPTQFLGSANNFDVIFKANGGTEKMRLTTTGNFGIGTATPGLRTHILGAMGFPATTGTSQIGVLRLQGTGSNGVMDFSVNAGNASCIQVTNSTNLSLNYALALNPNGGNVGIGTKTPSAKLEVMGGGIKATDGNGSMFYSIGFTRSGLIGQPDIYGDGTNPLVIGGKADGTGITSFSGLVGIGTKVISANMALDVKGGGIKATDGTGSSFYAINFTRSGFNGLPDISGDGTNPLVIGGKADGTGITSFSGLVGIGTKVISANMALDVKGGGIKATDGTGSMFYSVAFTRSGLVGKPDISGDGTHPLLIAGKGDGTGVTIISGNVGIGTSLNYDNSIEQYKLAVNGKIGAKSIKVEIGSGAWSDYVFDTNYKLKTIKELESFILKNQHLPNVPSACEVENNGIDMATMDATLLAKIEELSLYIIELSKKIEVLEQINTGK